MSARLLVAAPDAESLALYRALIASAEALLPLGIQTEYVESRAALTNRVGEHAADVLLYDWELSGAETPDYMRELIALDPRLRTIIIMPLALRQYRQCLWQAGVCVGLPKEHLDQEWLLSMLCLVTRAMQREERLLNDMEK